MEELPGLPRSRYGHACAALPSTGVRLAKTILSHFQAFIIAGGYAPGIGYSSSVVILLSNAPAWTFLTSLSRPLHGARASIVAGKMRLSGGYDGNYFRSEVRA